MTIVLLLLMIVFLLRAIESALLEDPVGVPFRLLGASIAAAFLAVSAEAWPIGAVALFALLVAFDAFRKLATALVAEADKIARGR